MKYQLGDVCDFYNGGAWSDKEYVSSGLPVLKVTNCKSKGFVLDDVDYLPSSSAQKYAKNKLKIGDVVIATVGSHPNLVDSAAGRSCIINSIVEGFYLNQNAVCIRTKDSEIIDQKYLGYLTKYRLFQHYIQMRGKGAANQMRIAIGAIKSYEFEFPEIEIQRRIGDILSAYDNLIENNQRQIKLLEEAAQRLYKEWFVDLRFPGYEDVKIVDGVPDGWTSIYLGEAISYEIGGGWGEESVTGNNEHEAYVIRGTDFDRLKNGEFLNIPLRYHTESNLSTRTLQHGDIVFEVSGGSRTEGVARTIRIVDSMLRRWNKPVICASFCKLVRPLNDEISQYLYEHLRYLRAEKITEEFDKRSASSIVNYRWKDFLNQRSLLYPSNNVLAKYNSIAVPLYDKIMMLSLQMESAKACRDRLIPKLMSGEIEL